MTWSMVWDSSSICGLMVSTVTVSFCSPTCEVRIDGGDAAGGDHGFDRVGVEAGRFHAHFIGAGGQRRHAELTALIAEQGAFERGGRVLHFDGGVGHDTAGRVVDGAGDFAGGRLGRQGRDENPKKQHPQKTLHLDIQTQ